MKEIKIIKVGGKSRIVTIPAWYHKNYKELKACVDINENDNLIIKIIGIKKGIKEIMEERSK